MSKTGKWMLLLCQVALLICLPLSSTAKGAGRFSSEPQVRVLLKQGRSSFKLHIAGSYVITELEKRKKLAWGSRLDNVEFKARGKGILVGKRHLKCRRITIQPVWEDEFKLDGRKYHGRLDVVIDSRGKLLVINTLRMEQYLEGVIGCEMRPDAPEEALKAQAVAARTYALACIQKEARTKKKRWYDLYCDTRSQVYGGLMKVSPRVRKAVRETRGQVLTYRGKVFTAYYHSTCGGQTEPASAIFSERAIPPLEGVKDPYCQRARLQSWKAKFTAEEIRDKLLAHGYKIGKIRKMGILKKRPSGRAETVGIYHGKKVKPLKVPAGEFMSVLGKDKVKSTWFDIKLDEGKYVIDGHGWGHGVGMCQAGAIAMARKKIGYKAILTHYYPKSALKRFWQ